MRLYPQKLVPLIGVAALFFSDQAGFSETLEIKEIANVTVYGATTSPKRNSNLITTRWNSSKSPYGITSFLVISLSSIPKGKAIKEVRFLVRTATHAHADGSRSIVLGYTADEFDPQQVSNISFDGITPWSQGHNAGVDPGTKKYPNLLSRIHGVTELDNWHTFQSPELTAYIQEQAEKGRDAYLYLTQGWPGQAGEFVIFRGPSSDDPPYLEVEFSSE